MDLFIEQVFNGIGNGVVTFAVAPGTAGVPRNGTIRVAGKEYAVKQK